MKIRFAGKMKRERRMTSFTQIFKLFKLRRELSFNASSQFLSNLSL